MQTQQTGKIVIITGSSGSGKNTLAKHLMNVRDDLSFAVSATSREMRPGEQEGVNYYYLTDEVFKQKIANQEFVEWEQVYGETKYGTLWEEFESIWREGKTIIADLEVKGAKNLKKLFGERALTIFLKLPSVEILEQRLRNRNTESEEKIQQRMDRVPEEMTYEKYFDHVLVNDDLEYAKNEVERIVSDFLDA